MHVVLSKERYYTRRLKDVHTDDDKLRYFRLVETFLTYTFIHCMCGSLGSKGSYLPNLIIQKTQVYNYVLFIVENWQTIQLGPFRMCRTPIYTMIYTQYKYRENQDGFDEPYATHLSFTFITIGDKPNSST